MLLELGSVTSLSPAAAVQEFVKEAAEAVAAMLLRLGALAESESDEGSLQQTLELHSAAEAALEQYQQLLAVAEGRASPADLIHKQLERESASVSAPPASQAQVGACHSRACAGACAHSEAQARSWRGRAPPCACRPTPPWVLPRTADLSGLRRRCVCSCIVQCNTVHPLNDMAGAAGSIVGPGLGAAPWPIPHARSDWASYPIPCPGFTMGLIFKIVSEDVCSSTTLNANT